jgi:hypothetical protein
MGWTRQQLADHPNFGKMVLKSNERTNFQAGVAIPDAQQRKCAQTLARGDEGKTPGAGLLIDNDVKEWHLVAMSISKQVCESYAKTKSIYKTAKQFSVCGETVRKILNLAGVSTSNRNWTLEEIAELKSAYENPVATDFSKLETRIRKSYNAIVAKAGELGISNISGGHLRRRKIRVLPKPKKTQQELSKEKSDFMVEWHARNAHPLAGKPVPESVRNKISVANLGRKVPPERTLRQLKTTVERYGRIAPQVERGRWQSEWIICGGKRLFARSLWEANYARYLEWQKVQGLILDWEHEPKTFWFENIRRGVRSYLPDFKVTMKNGSHEWHEVKGWMDARSKTKIKRMAKYYPAEALRVLDGNWFRDANRKLSGIVPDWATKRVRSRSK